MGGIFISHIEKDQAIMQQVALGLESAGYKTWYFERDVFPGTSYLIQITKAIESCDAMVLIVSPEALCSDQVTKEVVGAFERGKNFFPLLVNITPSELKHQQPEWRHALGGTAMIMADLDNFTDTLDNIIKGLKVGNITPVTVKYTERTDACTGSSAGVSSEVERKNVTVMFLSVSGFSAVSGKIDPEDLTELMNGCFSMIDRCIADHGGNINKFIGDSAMALFGAPRAQEDAPHRAIDAAIEIRRRVEEFCATSDLRISLDIHVGINTGTVIAGKSGGSRKQDYSITGETVTLASHIQVSAGKGEIIVSDSTYRLTEGYFDFEDIGASNIKGESQPVQIFRLIAPRQVRNRVDASIRKGLTPFQGRSLEMAHLMNCYKRTAGGEGQVVGIIGDPGMGKSRLVLEFLHTIPQEEFLYLRGSCQHFGENIPYHPILEIVRDNFNIKEDDGESLIREKIENKINALEGFAETLIPPLYELLSLKTLDESYTKLDGKQRREIVFDTLRMLLIAESRIKPLIIAVDDLHWIDNTSAEFLGYLTGSIATSRIMLVIQYRPDYTHQWSKKTYYSEIRLDHLTSDTGRDLIQAILIDGEVDSDLNDLIFSATSGNPLFMEELTRSMLENSSIVKTESRYILSGMPSAITIPDTIQGIIADRLDRLENSLKGILQTASVIGREFAYRVLEAVAALKDDLKSSMAVLQDLEFIYEKSVFPELEYIFKHSLTREVAYTSILNKRRRELHELVALSIEKIYAERIEEFHEILAYHYSMSGNNSKAYLYYRLSADKAVTKYAHNEALRFYREALQLLDNIEKSDDSSRERLVLIASMMLPLFFLGYPEGTYDLLRQAEILAIEVGSSKALANTFHLLSMYHSFKGEINTAITYAERSFDEAEKSGETELMLQNVDSLCSSHFMKGNMQKTADFSQRALNLFEDQNIDKGITWGKSHVYSGLCIWLGGSLTILGRVIESKPLLETAITLSLSKNNWLECASAYYFLAQISYFSGDGTGMISRGLNMVEYCEKGDARGYHGLALTTVGVGYLLLGDYKTAKGYAEKGLAVQKESGMNINTAWCDWFLSTILISDQDELARAGECAGEALNYALSIGAKHLEAATSILHSFSIGKRDPSRIDETIQSIQLGISMFEDMKLLPSVAIGYLYLGELLADNGRIEEARESLVKAESLFNEVGQHPQSYWISRIHGAIENLH